MLILHHDYSINLGYFLIMLFCSFWSLQFHIQTRLPTWCGIFFKKNCGKLTYNTKLITYISKTLRCRNLYIPREQFDSGAWKSPSNSNNAPAYSSLDVLLVLLPTQCCLETTRIFSGTRNIFSTVYYLLGMIQLWPLEQVPLPFEEVLQIAWLETSSAHLQQLHWH